MARKKPRRLVGEHHGDLRNALVSAALSLLNEAAPDALTLRQVARRAGVSAAAPYNHFADKNALLAAVAEDSFRQLGEALEVAAGQAKGAERLAAVSGEYVRFAVAHPAHYRVMFTPGLVNAPGSSLEQAARAALERLLVDVAGVRQALNEAALRRTGLLIWSMAHGAATLLIDGLLDGLEPNASVAEVSRDVARACVALAFTTGTSTAAR